jgi:alpha-D-xyloside xylohydrolase
MKWGTFLKGAVLCSALFLFLSCRQTSVRIPVPEGDLCLEPLSEGAIRVRLVPEGAPALDELVFTEKVRPPKFQVTEGEEQIIVSTERMSAEYNRETGALLFRAADGSILLEEKPGGRRVTETDIQGTPAFSVRQTFLSPPDEHLYGTGQFQDGVLDIRGLSRRLTQVNTQISVPMVLSNRGYGLLWHNYGLTELNPGDGEVTLENDGNGVFKAEIELEEAAEYGFLLDVGREMARRHFLSVDGEVLVDQTNTWLPPTVGFKALLEAGKHRVEARLGRGDKPVLHWRKVTDETTFLSPVGQGLDYTVFAGYADAVMHSFRTLSGSVPPMPDWAFRYIHCRERFSSQEELLATARRFHEEGIPVGTIVQDWQYWGRHGWNAMRFDEADYPDPASMVEQLHGMDQHFMLSVWSKVDKSSELGKSLVEKDFYIDGTDWVDFFRDDAAAFYWQNMRDRLVPLGIDAWWQDATEPENDDLKGRRIGLDALPGELYRNVYPLKVVGTVYEGLAGAGKAPVILTRSGFSGLQRYGAINWSGDVGHDWDALRRQIVGGLGLMAAGLPWWTFDAGGFFRPGDQYTSPEYQECMLRWIQTAVYLPFMRVHGYQSRTEPWEYLPETERLFKAAIARREALLPYILEQARKVSEEDYTLMRPLVFDFPNDQEALRQETEFMFGPGFLVCPVLQPGVTSWRVYLPENLLGWEDIHSGVQYKGGSYVDVPVTLEDIPVFWRRQLVFQKNDEIFDLLKRR